MSNRCENCGGRPDRPGLFGCKDGPHPEPTAAQRAVRCDRPAFGPKGE